jgi:predicted alpha/beta hydrolase family esterase
VQAAARQAPFGTPETPIDTEKVKQHVNQMIAIFSDDDDVVPLDNKEMFEQRLGAKTILEHGKGHFSGGDDITELPVALDSVLEIC